MSVIGRLDKQVDEILISPLSKGRRDESGPAPREEADDAPSPAPPGETTDRDENAANGGELPVWLL